MLACSAFPCSCAGLGAGAVELRDGRWFIVIGHAGFNSPANNRNGYPTDVAAQSAIRFYQRRGLVARARAARTA